MGTWAPSPRASLHAGPPQAGCWGWVWIWAAGSPSPCGGRIRVYDLPVSTGTDATPRDSSRHPQACPTSCSHLLLFCRPSAPLSSPLSFPQGAACAFCGEGCTSQASGCCLGGPRSGGQWSLGSWGLHGHGEVLRAAEPPCPGRQDTAWHGV